MIRLDDVRASLGAFTLRADFSVKAGGHLTLIGPSGGGKSTVLNVIAGFLAPDAGRVILDGEVMAGALPSARPLTLIFQEHNFFPHLDVASNVGLGLDPALRLSAAEKERVEAALGDVDLAGFGGRRPAELSGGQRQRVVIARALLRDKPILLLDEPFAALGPAQRWEMLALVERLRGEKGLTTMLVTHAPEDARRAGGAAALVAGGEVAPPVAVDDLLDQPPEALAAYLGKTDARG